MRDGRLDPVEPNRSAGGAETAKAGFGPTRGLLGPHPSGWGVPRYKRDRGAWRKGWNRGDRCPADPVADAAPGRRGWRVCGVIGLCAWWSAQHDKRRAVMRTARRAGYVARHRYERTYHGTKTVGSHVVDDWRYHDPGGRLDGLPCVDPWLVAKRLNRCGADWYVGLAWGPTAGLQTPAVPRLCGQRHVCPVCARRRSVAIASALRDIVSQEEATGPLVLVTLTQRARQKEALQDAFRRFKSSWNRMTKGRPGKRFRAMVHGWYLGMECGPTAARAGRWHVHGHVVLRLADGIDEADAREWLGEAWRTATKGVSGTDGWDPSSTVRGARMAGRWWEPIDPTDPRRVYQACKYPTPAGELGASQLVEYLAVSYGRRWHEGGGAYRGVIRKARELEASNDDLQTSDARNIAMVAPRAVPDLDAIAPDLGWEGMTERPPLQEWARWVLAEGVDVDTIGPAVSEAGGAIEEDGCGPPRVWLPTGWVSRALRGISSTK